MRIFANPSHPNQIDMKRILIFATAASVAFALSCRPEPREEDPGILAYAVCEMDIHPGSKAKAVDIEGDSAAVHQLARYACLIRSPWDSSWINGVEALSDYYFFDLDGIFSRDTVGHTFSFQNDAVIMFEDIDINQVGQPGSEYLGWLACYVEPVFCALYDTVSKCYSDPMVGFEEFQFKNQRIDTLGYVPKEMMARNRERLLQLMAEQRFQEMIDLYKSEYRIYTCTGAEYRDIVRRRQDAAK